MTVRPLLAFLFCFLLQPLPAPAQNAADTPDRMMTEERAFSLLRSSGASASDLGFVTVRRLEPTQSTRQTAEESLKEARSRHLEPYWDGVLTDMMREGGFVILEVDQRFDTAKRLYLVTLDEAGKPLVQSGHIEGDISRSDALALLSKSQELSDAFFASPGPSLKELLRRFGGGRLPDVEPFPDAEKYSVLPERVFEFATPDELQDLSVLATAVLLWPVRQAPALPIYAANPEAAVKMAQEEQLKLFKEFSPRKGNRFDFIHLLDFDSIATYSELAARLQRLRELNSFLDQHCPFRSDSATYQNNVGISTIPVELGVEQDSGRLYGVVAISDLLSGWIRTESGEFTLKVLVRPPE
jgi:hypothetical protein